MMVLLSVFVMLCVGTIIAQKIKFVRTLGLRLNAVLIGMALAMLALWYGVRLYSPPLTIYENWRMTLISMIGFLCALLSTTTALRSLMGVRSGIVVAVSLVVGVLHLIDLIVSIPVS
jgi:hypothetical protein